MKSVNCFKKNWTRWVLGGTAGLVLATACSQTDKDAEPEGTAASNQGGDRNEPNGSAGDDNAGNQGGGMSAGGANDPGEGRAGAGDGAGQGGGGTAEGGAGGEGGASGEETHPVLAGCVRAVRSWYTIVSDGGIYLQYRNQQQTQQVIIDDSTGTPLKGAVDAAGARFHGCAALEDGTAKCWREGDNGNLVGQLGNGATDIEQGPLFRATPVLVDANQPLRNIRSLTPTEDIQRTSCAITDDGRLYCWGDLTWAVNGGEELISGYAVPITTNGETELTGVLDAVVTPHFSCALVEGSPNKLYCWGSNYSYNLGQGDQTNRRYPTLVSGLTHPSMVRAVSYNSIGYLGGTVCVADEGEVRCWGANSVGEAGVDTATRVVLSPTAVRRPDGSAFPAPVELQAAARGTFCARTSSRALWCWGNDYTSTAENYGVTNVVGLGGFWRQNNNSAEPRYLTSDGTYHIGSLDEREPICPQE